MKYPQMKHGCYLIVVILTKSLSEIIIFKGNLVRKKLRTFLIGYIIFWYVYQKIMNLSFLYTLFLVKSWNKTCRKEETGFCM